MKFNQEMAITKDLKLLDEAMEFKMYFEPIDKEIDGVLVDDDTSSPADG